MKPSTSARLLASALAIALAGGASVGAQEPLSGTADGGWRQWGGPARNFTSPATKLADVWPNEGPPQLWSRPLGLGHSAILFDEGMLYTMYRPGSAASRSGPFVAEEVVIALEAATGKTVWEYKYPSQPLNFSYGAGPHATPLIVGDRLFTSGTNKQIHAFDKRTGRLLWSVDLVREHGAPPTLIALRSKPVMRARFSPIATS